MPVQTMSLRVAPLGEPLLHGLGLNTDRKRFIRLFFQPLMCAVGLHGGGLLPRSKRLR